MSVHIGQVIHQYQYIYIKKISVDNISILLEPDG